MIRSLSILLITVGVLAPSLIDKLGFYRVFESDSKIKMEQKLTDLEKMKASSQKNAYIGALTMKRSQFEKTPKQKADMFIKGRHLLEKAIKSNPKNAEYRFLRLAIQENSPKILKYKDQIEEDKKIIEQSFKGLDTTVKQVIKRYASNSKYLSTKSLK